MRAGVRGSSWLAWRDRTRGLPDTFSCGRYPLALLAEAHGYLAINLVIVVTVVPLFLLRY